MSPPNPSELSFASFFVPLSGSDTDGLACGSQELNGVQGTVESVRGRISPVGLRFLPRRASTDLVLWSLPAGGELSLRKGVPDLRILSGISRAPCALR